MAATSVNELIEQVLPAIKLENIVAHAAFLSKLQRTSGTPDGEKAAQYILERLAEYQLGHEGLEFTGYLSAPLGARLEMVSPVHREYDVVAAGFSENAENLEGELFYDYMSEKETLTQKENKERFAQFKDKIVLTRHFLSKIVLPAEAAGARGMIQMYPSGEKVPHYLGTSSVWGTPTTDNQHLIHHLPCVNATKDAGEELIAQLKKGPVRVSMSARGRNGLTHATIPAARIPGEEENFVLISGHYDSHHEGMTDNGAGDAIMLELARVFHEMRGRLKRSIVICWWAGHEYGNYGGSVWFSDTYWEQLRDKCVAHINIDVAGCRDALQIRPRTTRMEGKRFTDELIREFTGLEPKPYVPLPHVGEQSFLGREIPITIMLKYEILSEKRYFFGAGGGYWWHTRDDTLDKVDFDIAMRDAKINAKMICQILNADHIPVDLVEFVEETRHLLGEIEEQLAKDFDLSPIHPRLNKLKAAVAGLTQQLPKHSHTDAVIKKVAGELIRVQFTYSSPYEYDRLGMPSNFQKFRAAMGVTPENTDADQYLFIKTDFIRQRNRLAGEIDKIIETIEYQLLKWSCGQ